MHSLWRNDRVYGDTYVNYFELIISLYVCELTLYLSRKSKKQCIHEKRHHMVLHKYAKIRPFKKKKTIACIKSVLLGHTMTRKQESSRQALWVLSQARRLSKCLSL